MRLRSGQSREKPCASVSYHLDALTLTISGWSRVEIETAIERLIELLDSDDALSADLEPDAESCRLGDGLPGDLTDAEADQPTHRLRAGRRLRR